MAGLNPRREMPAASAGGEAARSLDSSTGSVVRIALSAAVVLGTALRLRAFFSGRSLWADEFSLALNLRDRGFIALLTAPLDSHQSAPPGFLLLARTSVDVLGPTDVAVRLVALLSGIGLLLLSVPLALGAFRSATARIGMVWALALSPVLVYYSHEAKQYSSDALATVIVMLLWTYRSRLSARFLALTGAGIAVLSLPGLLMLPVLGSFMLLERLNWFGWSVQSPSIAGSGRPARISSRNLLGVMSVWVIAAGLHLFYGLSVGGHRAYMQDWWTVKGGFPPLLPWDRAEVSWLVSTASRATWLALGHEGRAAPGMDRGPLLATGLVLAVASFGVLLSVRRRALGPLLPAALVGSAMVASVARLYPFSSRLIVFLIPAILATVFHAVDSVQLEPGSRRAVSRAISAAVLGLLIIPGVPSVERFVAPLDDRDVRGALGLVRDLPGRSNLVLFEYGMLDWYEPVIGDLSTSMRPRQADELQESLRELDTGEVEATWVISAHNVEETEDVLDGIGRERFACVQIVDETLIAVAARDGAIGDAHVARCRAGIS